MAAKKVSTRKKAADDKEDVGIEAGEAELESAPSQVPVSTLRSVPETGTASSAEPEYQASDAPEAEAAEGQGAPAESSEPDPINDFLAKTDPDYVERLKGLDSGDQSRGLYPKYRVDRRIPASKHEACFYFLIDAMHDEFAPDAFRAYAAAAGIEYDELARQVVAGAYDRAYIVARADGRSAQGEKHADCRYLVLDIDHDPAAPAALAAYAAACAEQYPQLAADLASLTRPEIIQ